MKLDFIEMCGFRGFREKVRIDFGGGFTVISGRNGVGKSTVCDAIEFGLTGQISKYAVESADRENVRDYYWWRGSGRPESHFVRVGFSNDASEPFVVTRTLEDQADKSVDEIVHALCIGDTPEDPITQLIKTSVLRDEWIAAQSLDLKETERFDLVRAAFGAVENSEYSAKAKEIVKVAEDRVKSAESAYESTKSELSRSLADFSQASELAIQNTDVEAAVAALRSILRHSSNDKIPELRNAAVQLLPTIRAKRLALEQASVDAGEIEQLRAEYESPEAQERRSELATQKRDAGRVFDERKLFFEEVQRKLEIEEAASSVAASLSGLLEHGEHVGLHEEHCPLCAAARTSEEFEAGLQSLRARIGTLASGISEARAAAREALVTMNEAEKVLSSLDVEISEAASLQTTIMEKEAALRSFFEENDLPIEHINDPEHLSALAGSERNRVVEAERAINALDTSRSVNRLNTLNARVTDFRGMVEQAADELEACQTALAQAKALDKNVRRSASEIIDERLALVSPLLDELYQRLRPHTDWRKIEYSIRGDVRRFLSLKVGNELNPQFVFSSGQRRAAGIAFLLSVHLARSWSNWQTLVLDDPVQHVDDFRALHLVEVLSAIRQGGRQIVCAVEDEALAQLICRRLPRSEDEPGIHYTIDIDSESSGSIIEATPVPNIPNSVLRNTQDSQQIG